ncbi:iron uptake system protein EfeO [Niallia nealsonii]|uniref:Efem/EfeO family lipoprotein n=1 Tax=Niallia nealsonii TaxID=115979 RepID=A0A2N0YZN3_9BACI|nr:iron uptake system protein EfeO [Niallia nealsonii]PKG22709.1 Efem/EfeO family lipoprotein [Niallia nealsonii]
MKKFYVLFLSIVAAASLVACNSATTTSSSNTETDQKEKEQATTIKTEVKEMEEELQGVETAVKAKDKEALTDKAAAMHKHWLEFENNVRDLYPLLYTDIEKYETPIFYESKNETPDFTALTDNAAGLKVALQEVGNAKETKEKTSEVMEQAVKNYQEYVSEQVGLLVESTKIFAEAVKANDIDKSKEYYAKSRVYYERIEPIAESFGDLDPKIDARINDVEDKSEWTGFHVIEQSIWEKNSLKGMDKYADQLMTDIIALQTEVNKLTLESKPMVAGAMELLNEAATTKVTGEEEAYSHIDLVDLNANVEGSKVVYQAIIPALNENDAKLADDIDNAFNKMEEILAKYKQGNGFISHTDLKEEQIREISDQLSHLSELMSQTGKIF